MLENLKKMVPKMNELATPVCQSVADKCKASHERYLEQKKERIRMERLNRIQFQQDEIQSELALALQNYTYPKIAPVKSIADLRQDGYKINNSKVIYYFTIDKTVWETFPQFVCKELRDSMNKDIILFMRNLMALYPIEDIVIQYPALYYGARIVLMENHEIMVRLAVITNMPL